MSRAYSPDDFEDPECGPSGTLRIVLVRVRDAEVGADPVSLLGLHRAAVLLDRLTHLGHALTDERLHVLRRKSLAEGGRTDDVGEQHGDRAELVPAAERYRRRAVAPELWSGLRGAGRQRRILSEDGRLEVAKGSTGLETELLPQDAASGLYACNASAWRPER